MTGDPNRQLTTPSEDLYDCRSTHPYPSGGSGYLCQEKMCGGPQEVSEYTHVWNVHPPNICGQSPDTTTTLQRISSAKNSTALNTFNPNSTTLGNRDKLAYMELDSTGQEIKHQS